MSEQMLIPEQEQKIKDYIRNNPEATLSEIAAYAYDGTRCGFEML